MCWAAGMAAHFFCPGGIVDFCDLLDYDDDIGLEGSP